MLVKLGFPNMKEHEVHVSAKRDLETNRQLKDFTEEQNKQTQDTENRHTVTCLFPKTRASKHTVSCWVCMFSTICVHNTGNTKKQLVFISTTQTPEWKTIVSIHSAGWNVPITLILWRGKMTKIVAKLVVLGLSPKTQCQTSWNTTAQQHREAHGITRH